MNKVKSMPGMIRLVLLCCLLTGAAADVSAQSALIGSGFHDEWVPVGDIGVVQLPALGGTGGGQFQDVCPKNTMLSGFKLRAADDVDAISPDCVMMTEADDKASSPTSEPGGTAEWRGGMGEWHGGTGGSVTQLLCPDSTPIVIGVDVGAEGVNTIVVKTIHLFCGRAVNAQTAAAYPSAMFDGPPDHAAPAVFGIGGDSVHHGGGSERCPAGKVAVGMHGRSGIWLDAMGLVCDSAIVVMTRRDPVRPVALGRVPVPASSPPLSVCEAAKDARARNSPAAPNLEAQCRWQHSPEGAMEQAAQHGVSTGGQLNWSQSTPNAVGIHGSATSVFNPTMAPRSIESSIPTGSRAAVSAAATPVTRATVSTAVVAPASGARAAIASSTNAPAAISQGAAQMPAGRVWAAPGAAAVSSVAPSVRLPCLRPVTSGAGLQAATNHAGISVAGGTSTLPCKAEAMGNPQESGQAAGLKPSH